MERPLALVVDRDPAVRAVVRDIFEEHAVVALGASSGIEAMESLRSRPVRILVIDWDTQGVDALELLRYGSRLQPSPVPIGMLSSGDGARAAEFFEAGALEVLYKPLDEPRVQRVVRRALRHHGLLDEIRQLREELQSREGYHGLVGRSSQMERLRERMQRLALTDAPVWFVGEVGTGKEFAARTLHAQWKGPESPFAVVDCLALGPDNGVTRLGSGLEELAGGAVYLENLPTLALDAQARLARVLQGLRSESGGPGLRVFASSTSDPRTESENVRLLDDLRRELAGETLHLAPLRERTEDIPLLARHFITTICAINHLPPIDLAPETLSALERYRWSENVQELRNAMEQAVILAEDGKIRPKDLPDRIMRGTPVSATGPATHSEESRSFRDAKREVVERFERSYLAALMGRFGGNVTAAAQQAGMLRSALQRLLRKYGLKSAEFRKSRQAAGARDDSHPSS